MSQWKKDDKERNQNDKLGDEVYTNPSETSIKES